MICLRQVEVRLGCVLRPLVTVEGKSTSDLFLLQGLTNGVRSKSRGHVGADFPRKDDLQHIARNRNIGNVRHPELIGLYLIKVSVQQIWVLMNRLLVSGIGPATTNS